MARLAIWATVGLGYLVATLQAQIIAPRNDTSALLNNVLFILDSMGNGTGLRVNVAPLTQDAGINGSLAQLKNVQPSGPFELTNGTNDNITAGAVCYINCEAAAYNASSSPAQVVRTAVDRQPSAIVLYSLRSASCSFQPTTGFAYASFYTMLDTNSSAAVAVGLAQNQAPNPTANIRVNQTSINTSNDNANAFGKSPTTAVAMIVLYSITGIITALFLIIICVGAIRAHRHPERYGPRHVMGRPRQSRAKGIARAMLETLPIVKFGDDKDDIPLQAHEDKPPRDLEAGPVAQSAVQPTPEVPDQATSSSSLGEKPAEADDTANSANPIDEGLACSVCTDDFVKGQDIRLLPCKHKFHPECIDPWLLNVSGTCPLCRIDLRPAQSPETVPEADESVENDPAQGPRHRSRIMNTLSISRMVHASPQERIEALRALRQHTSPPSATARSMDEADRSRAPSRSRLSQRFTRTFGTSSRPVSTRRSSRPASRAPSVVASEHVDDEPAVIDRRRYGSFAG